MVYMLREKSQVVTIFKYYKLLIETQANKTLKTLRVDNTQELVSRNFQIFLLDSRIKLETIVLDSSAQNSIAK